MTRSELIDKVHSVTEGFTKKQIAQALDTFINSIKDGLSRDDKVEIRSFGNFKVRERSARKARNPRTGEMVEVPSKKVPYFKVGKELKEMVEAKKQ
jgi:integration host factor subunit beta